METTDKSMVQIKTNKNLMALQKKPEDDTTSTDAREISAEVEEKKMNHPDKFGSMEMRRNCGCERFCSRGPDENLVEYNCLIKMLNNIESDIACQHKYITIFGRLVKKQE